MSTIVTKASKGSILTSVEMDANLDNLNADKIESNTASTAVGNIVAYSTTGGRQIKVATAAEIVAAIGATAVANATAAGFATNATNAVNLTGGLGGSIPYQTDAGTTAMLANGAAGQILQSNGGTAAPSWVAAPSDGTRSQRIITSDYTAVLDDRSSFLHHTASDTLIRDVTIPTNASVPYAIGTVLVIVNDKGAHPLRILCGDTIEIALKTLMDSFGLAVLENSYTTLLKIGTTKWLADGTNLAVRHAITTSTPIVNFDVATAMTAAGWDGVTPLLLDHTLSGSGVIGSVGAGTVAYRSLNLPIKSFVNLVLNSGTYITGAGGLPSGGSGGTALQVTNRVNLTNNGTIGGGGGAGGNATSRTGIKEIDFQYFSAAGGIGAGHSTGNVTTGGAATVVPGNLGYSGAGGALGASGTSGTGNYSNGSGGSPGAAINGVAYVNKLVTGTILGAQV